MNTPSATAPLAHFDKTAAPRRPDCRSGPGKTYDMRQGQRVSKSWRQPVTIQSAQNVYPTGFLHLFWNPQDVPATPLRTVTSTAMYDPFGNAEHVLRLTQGGQLLNVDTTYINDTANWLIGLPETQVLSTTKNGKTSQREIVYEYDTAGRGLLTKVTVEPNGGIDLRSVTELGYHPEFGVLLSSKMAAAGHAAPYETRYEYAPWPAQAPQEWIYPSQIWSPNGPEGPNPPIDNRPSLWLQTHPGYGETLAAIDRNGKWAKQRIDGFAHTVASQTLGEQETTVSVAGRPDSAGGITGLIVTATVGGQTATVETNGLGQTLRRLSTPFHPTDTRVVDYEYDALSRVSRISRPYRNGGSPAAHTEFRRDALNRITDIWWPKGSDDPTPPLVKRRTGYAYDITADYFEVTTSDPLNHTGYVRYDRDGRLIESGNWLDGQVVRTTFQHEILAGGQGNSRLTVTSPEGHATISESDKLGRLRYQDDPDAGTTQVDVNGLGQVQALHHVQTGLLTTFGYDGLGRLTALNQAEGNTEFHYDGAANGLGKLWRTVRDNLGDVGMGLPAIRVETLHGYDSAGRPTTTDWILDGPNGQESYTLGLNYDAAGRAKALEYPRINGMPGLTAHYGYTNTEYVDRIDYSLGLQDPQTRLWTVYDRNLDDALVQGEYGSGMLATRNYDLETGALKAMQVTRIGIPNVDLLNLSFDYYRNGAMLRRTDAVSDRVEEYEYDSLDRLTQRTLDHGAAPARETEYGYSPDGNLLTMHENGVLSERNHYANPMQPHTATLRELFAAGQSVAAVSYAYDGRGRQDEQSDQGQIVRAIEYTQEDLPRWVMTGSQATRYAYDAFNQRVLKDTDGNGPARTVYIGDDLYEKRVTVSGHTTHVYQIAGVGQVIRADSGLLQPKVEYTLSDNQGSAQAVVDGQGQLVGERRYYSPFGRREAVDGSAPTSVPGGNLWDGFTGHEHEDALGLINMKGRLYDPELQRFLTPDPIVMQPAFGQSWNPYSYVVNNPTNLVDPSGLHACAPTHTDECLPQDGGGEGEWFDDAEDLETPDEPEGGEGDDVLSDESATNGSQDWANGYGGLGGPGGGGGPGDSGGGGPGGQSSGKGFIKTDFTKGDPRGMPSEGAKPTKAKGNHNSMGDAPPPSGVPQALCGVVGCGSPPRGGQLGGNFIAEGGVATAGACVTWITFVGGGICAGYYYDSDMDVGVYLKVMAGAGFNVDAGPDFGVEKSTTVEHQTGKEILDGQDDEYNVAGVGVSGAPIVRADEHGRERRVSADLNSVSSGGLSPSLTAGTSYTIASPGVVETVNWLLQKVGLQECISGCNR